MSKKKFVFTFQLAIVAVFTVMALACESSSTIVDGRNAIGGDGVGASSSDGTMIELVSDSAVNHLDVAQY